jgi:uncharacterized membrane protein YwzB
MILEINVYGIIYTCVFLVIFVLAYITILYTNLEKLFKQGSVWAIRVAQVLISIAIAYLVTQGIMGLVSNTQF